MSWDVAPVKIRGDLRPIAEVATEDYLPPGSIDAVRDAIKSAFPSAKWSSPNGAILSGDGFTITFNLDGVVRSNTILLNVHGQAAAIPHILHLTETAGWLAVDCSEGEFLELRQVKSMRIARACGETLLCKIPPSGRIRLLWQLFM